MNISFWSILVVLLMLGVLVTIHELGHFWAACLLKIKAYEVSIFVGPKLLSWKRNGVDYSLRCLPLGAYVRFTDIDDEGNPITSDDPHELLNQPRWKRLLVSLAGPFMNMVLGIVLFIILFCTTGYTTLQIGHALESTQLYGQEYSVGDTIVAIDGHHVFTYLDFYYEIDDGSSLEEKVITLRSAETGKTYDVVLTPTTDTRPMLGIQYYPDTDNRYNGWEIVTVYESQNNNNPVLKVGDFLTHVDGRPVADEGFDEFFHDYVEGDTMTLTYVRNGVTHEAECVKTLMTTANDRGVRIIAKKVDSVGSFFESCKYASMMPITIINVSIKSISSVFEGEEEVYNMVSGPVGVTSVVSDVVDNVDRTTENKVENVILLAGIISIGLMFTNMLPIPGLDGVQVVLIIIEMIIGHKLSSKAENVVNAIGFFMLIALVIFAFASDIIRIVKGG